MVKPATSIRNTAPTSEIGIATIGIRTERNEPRNRKITTMTMSSVSVSVRSTSLMRVLDVLGRVVGMPTFIPAGSCVSICGSASRTFAITSSVVGGRQHPHAHERRRLAVEADVLVVVLRAQHDVGDVAEPDDHAVLLLTTSWRNSSGVRRSVLAIRFTDTIEPLVLPSAER